MNCVPFPTGVAKGGTRGPSPPVDRRVKKKGGMKKKNKKGKEKKGGGGGKKKTGGKGKRKENVSLRQIQKEENKKEKETQYGIGLCHYINYS